jgi:hypothetical protein
MDGLADACLFVTMTDMQAQPAANILCKMESLLQWVIHLFWKAVLL